MHRLCSHETEVTFCAIIVLYLILKRTLEQQIMSKCLLLQIHVCTIQIYEKQIIASGILFACTLCTELG
jgi:hypothetical protein